jgi:endonuclease YncB( thermonuclease family)
VVRLHRSLPIVAALFVVCAACSDTATSSTTREGSGSTPAAQDAEATVASIDEPQDDTTVSSEVAQVVRVIDGDTIVITLDGIEERVRVIGIDTPERGDCGFVEASEELERLLSGGVVELLGGIADDRDRYDRLLRYLEVDGIDLGYLLIREGFAHAAYDSRSGYEEHPREDDYITADESSTDLCP